MTNILIAAASAKEVFSTIGSILLALVALLIMITIHELGHYSVGKMLGFGINEFAIGFGPKLFSKKVKSGEVFSIRLIPLGGFCAFLGEDEDNENPKAFNNQKPWKRILVLLAGVFFNFITAIFVFTILFSTYGYNYPKVFNVYTPQDSTIVLDESNIMKDDIILKINGNNIYTFVDSTLTEALAASEDEVTFTVIRNGEEIEVKGIRTVYITKFLYEFTTDDGYTEEQLLELEQTYDGSESYTGFGISTGYTMVPLKFFPAIGHTFVYTGQVFEYLFKTIGGLFTGAVGIKNNLGGTVTTISVMSNSIRTTGFYGFLFLIGLMSISLAITNALPIPALDGAHVIFVIIEWIIGKPINRKVEGIIHTVGLVLLFGLAIMMDIMNWSLIGEMFGG